MTKDTMPKPDTGVHRRAGSTAWQWRIKVPKDLLPAYPSEWAHRTSLTLELTLSLGRFAAWVSSRIDGRRRRVVHRWRGARHANADGGQPVFDAPRMVFGVVAPFEVDR